MAELRKSEKHLEYLNKIPPAIELSFEVGCLVPYNNTASKACVGKIINQLTTPSGHKVPLLPTAPAVFWVEDVVTKAQVAVTRSASIWLANALHGLNSQGFPENLFTPDCIRLLSGGYLNLKTLNVEVITPFDLAHGLATKYRFGGFSYHPLTVAEHSIWCADRVSPENKFTALMHDAPEAILGDMMKPIKNLLPDFEKLEHRLAEKMAAHFGFIYPIPEEVHNIDRVALEHEWNEVVINNTVQPLSVLGARKAFTEKFNQLRKEKLFSKLEEIGKPETNESKNA